MTIRNHRLMQGGGAPVRFVPTPNMAEGIQPEILVMHFTAGRDLASAVAWLANPASRSSAHVVIGRDGSIVQMVPFHRKAWHAGPSHWRGRSGVNDFSIGIELDNAGPMTQQDGQWRAWFGDAYRREDVMVAKHPLDAAPRGWHTYTGIQLEVAHALAALLVRTYSLRAIVGHEEISPRWKRDPGPAFPMERFRALVGGESGMRPAA